MVGPATRGYDLLFVEAGRSSKRVRGEEAGKGEYSISAETDKGFHTSIYEDFPLVTDGEVTTGMSYHMTLDGAKIIPASEPDKNDSPYIDVTTGNSWLMDMVYALVCAGSFFVTAFSRATFIAASYGLTQHETHSKTNIILRWTLIGVVLLDYSIQFTLSWRQSREHYSLLVAAGDLVFNDDIHTGQGSTVSARNRWKTFLCLTLAHMLNLSNKLAIGPIYFQTRKISRIASNFKAGNARVSFVGYRNAWEFHVEDRLGQYGRLQASIVTDTLVIVLKAVLSAFSSVNWFFIIVNIGVPILFLMMQLKDVWSLRSLRAGFRQRLEEDAKSNDPTVRAISHVQLHKHYGVNVTRDVGETESLKAPATLTQMEMLARRVDKSLENLTFHLEALEKGDKLYPGEGLRLLQPIRQRMRQASFPCFFEVAPPAGIHVSPLGFPHDLGPYSLQALDIDLRTLSPLTTPTSQRARTTPWKLPLGIFGGSAVAIDCATDDTVQGCLSALSEVTLDSHQKRAVGIPPDACWFAWSYPVATGDRISQNTFAKRASCNTGPENFLISGGYVYFNSDLKLVKILAARTKREGGELTGLLGFQTPIPILDPGPLAKILKEARAARTGFPLPAHCGGEECKHLRYMWLASREIESEKPSHGGFLFYEEDQRSEDL